MDDVNSAAQEDPSADAAKLLKSVGVSRIVVVDDEYAVNVEELLGICSELDSQDAVRVPKLGDIDFESSQEVWKQSVREIWETLDNLERISLLTEASAIEAAVDTEENERGADDPLDEDDVRAATCLKEVLGNLSNCEFITLSLAKWTEQSETFLNDEKAAETLLLFDRDFTREGGSAEDGLRQLQKLQSRDVGYYGLISHTVSLGEEYEAWETLSKNHGLARERLVVISKERLNSDPPDCYGFLGMLRLAAMSGRYFSVRSKAWCIFEKSVDQAKQAVEKLSPLDFDRIVFESSRLEGVSESDTLLRVFGILMRRFARERLHGDSSYRAAVEDARRVSAMPKSIARALRDSEVSHGAVQIQRFEMYDHGDELNNIHSPLELGDIFENVSSRTQYILLTQPCDLMVRKNGRRSYDDKLGRMGTLVELVVGHEKEKDSWEELPFYEEETGKPAFANFTKAHQVKLAVLDLCVFGIGGEVKIEVGGPCPELIIEPWKRRHTYLQRFFRTALTNHKILVAKKVPERLRLLALPKLSTSVTVQPHVNADVVHYGIKRMLRIRQPWSSALLTAFSQHQARAAFEHRFERLDIAQ